MNRTLVSLLLLVGATIAQGATVNLPAPNILGVACGGYQSGSSVTIVGFDTNGNIQGTLYEVISCSSGGRGSVPKRYTGSSNITWDFRGGYITTWNASLATAAVGNVATDAYGNVVMPGVNSYTLTSTLTINQMPADPDYVEALVPNLIGDTDATARTALVTADLLYGNETINPTYPAPAGQVFNQQPAAGTLVPFETLVNVWETPSAKHGRGQGD